MNFIKCATKKWLKLMVADFEELNDINEIISKKKYWPKEPFAFTNYSFLDIKVVILDAEPYSDGTGDGLAFSNGRYANNIFAALLKQGVIDKMPSDLSLDYLARQGVVLINYTPTVERGKPGSHVIIWQAWMDRFITRLSEATTATWCLWGNEMKKKSNLINQRNTVLTHCHPSVDDFLTCDHFKFNIVWDPSKTETHFYTDCAAPNNQSADCRASWGVVCTRGLMMDQSWGEEIAGVWLVQHGGKIPPEVKGVRPKYRGCNFETYARPTNIRGEGWALVKAFEQAAKLPNYKVVIHTDSKLWIDMLTCWIPGWIEKNSDFNCHKNPDIAERLWLLYSKSSAALQFVNAFHDRKEPARGTLDHDWWTGNQAAEECAQQALKN